MAPKISAVSYTHLQAVQDIQAAIEACKAHPVQEVTPPNNNNQKPNDNTNNNANTDKNDNTNKGDTASGTCLLYTSRCV